MPLVLLIAWIVATVVVILDVDDALLGTFEVGTRYVFALPAALLAAWALWGLRRGRSDKIARYLAAGSSVFLAMR